jgi:hypothetical protein
LNIIGSSKVGVGWGGSAMRSVACCVVLLLLAVTAVARAAPGTVQPRMPDPCIEAANLPFCR